MQDLLIKAANREDFSQDLESVVQFYGTVTLLEPNHFFWYSSGPMLSQEGCNATRPSQYTVILSYSCNLSFVQIITLVLSSLFRQVSPLQVRILVVGHVQS